VATEKIKLLQGVLINLVPLMREFLNFGDGYGRCLTE